MSKATKMAAARAAYEAESAARAALRLKRKKEAEAKDALVRQKLATYEIKPLSGVCGRVGAIAPRLCDNPVYQAAVESLLGFQYRGIRPLEDWEPRGKGRETLFRSLAEHLFAKYKTPPFLWSVFFEANAAVRAKLIPVVVSIAGGASFYEEVKTGGLPVPLTRKMCHEILGSSSEVTFLQAIRRAQTRAEGGDSRLWKAWVATSPGRDVGTEANELFWVTVLRFLAQNPMLDRAKVGPIVDYVQYRRGVEPDFSMKGRSANALLTSMEEWHGELQAAKGKTGHSFQPSGFSGAMFDRSREGPKGHFTEIWRIREILTGVDLAREGRNNKHCVYSYSRSIESGECSIWSMTREDNSGNWHALTIEVRNSTKLVVQARGMMNRQPTGPESNVLAQWAEQNGLKVALAYW